MTEATPLNWHENFIVSLAQVIRPQVYVELGLYHCELFNQLIPFAGKLIGVDLSPEAGQFMTQSAKTQFINLTTQEYAAYLHNNPIMIDLLFIDADHDQVAVIDDFTAFFAFIRPHGLILLHDTHPSPELMGPGYCGDAYRAIATLSKENTYYELLTIPIPPGLTICRKRDQQLSWQENQSQ